MNYDDLTNQWHEIESHVADLLEKLSKDEIRKDSQHIARAQSEVESFFAKIIY